MMSDLRESGISSKMPMLLCLYIDEVYNPDSEYKGTAEIIIIKAKKWPDWYG